MALTIQERLKDLRVERGLILEQLASKPIFPSPRWAAMKRTNLRTSATTPLSSWRNFMV